MSKVEGLEWFAYYTPEERCFFVDRYKLVQTTKDDSVGMKACKHLVSTLNAPNMMYTWNLRCVGDPSFYNHGMPAIITANEESGLVAIMTKMFFYSHFSPYYVIPYYWREERNERLAELEEYTPLTYKEYNELFGDEVRSTIERYFDKNFHKGFYVNNGVKLPVIYSDSLAYTGIRVMKG